MSSVMTLEKVASPVTITSPAIVSNDLDPYPHGWRYVRRSVNGEDKWVRVALRRDDVLHPQLGDKKVHSEYHERFSTYLYDVLAQQIADDPHAVVLHDVGIVWNDTHLKHHAPDIAVIFDVQKRKEWSTFNVAEEGTKPALVIEVTSLSNRSTDVADKLDEYEAAGVPLYIIVDTYRYRGKLYRRLLGYKLGPNGRYEVMTPNEKKWLWLEPVRLWINVDDNGVVCYDASGEAIADYIGVVSQRNKARSQAQAAAQAREAAEAQAQAANAEVERLLAELARLRGT